MQKMLDSMEDKPTTFQQEFFPEDVLIRENLPYTVERSEEDEHIFIVEGPRIEKMLGYTNLVQGILTDRYTESSRGNVKSRRAVRDSVVPFALRGSSGDGRSPFCRTKFNRSNGK